MKVMSLLVLISALVLGACATTKGPPPSREAVEDFIKVNQLESVDKAGSSHTGDGFSQINEYYVIFKGRRGDYLFEFVRRCFELRDNTVIVPDTRDDPNWIRARFDTLRGCRIAKIYSLNEAQVAELETLGEAPGDRNQVDRN